MVAAASLLATHIIDSASEETMSLKESTKFITYIAVLWTHTENRS